MPDTSYLEWPFLEDHHRKLALDLDRWAAETLPAITDTKAAHKELDQPMVAYTKIWMCARFA